MVVGVCTIVLHIPESQSLKDKRRVLRSLKDKLRQEFNLSVAEVGDNDLWQRAVLGLAVVANEGRFADEAMAKAVDLIRRRSDVELLDYGTEIR
ncbi:MAG TPA: DUF503 domain-containing protein [candidate division Zixibacteria bacterium]|nr:DUF503 domain-containing protein [candidate division Zixibacteria bacterium]